MRDYAKIAPQFWIGATGKQIRALGLEAQLVALYLITSPHATMLGIYYLPVVFMSHEIGLPLEGATKALKSLCEIGFCSYDAQSEYVWVHEMAFYQIGEQLKPADNRVKNANEAYQALPNLPFLKDFFDKYKKALCLEIARENSLALQGPCKPLRSQEQDQEHEQEQEQEQKQEQKQEQEKIIVAPSITNAQGARPEEGQAARMVFMHWKTVMQHPNANLDEKRKKLINKALRAGYSVDQLCDAITGCSLTPHNVGDNEQGQRYDGLHVILRDADQIDRFINNARRPPKPLPQAERQALANVRALQNWLSGTQINEGGRVYENA